MANEWKYLSMFFFLSLFERLLHDGKQFFLLLPMPFHFSHSESFSLSQIDIFASHIYTMSECELCTSSRVSFAAKSHILLFALARAPKSLHLKVIHLFAYTLSKHNTHNPIRLFANDNNVSCSKHFQTFLIANKGIPGVRLFHRNLKIL